jgi:polyphenol oxidase
MLITPNWPAPANVIAAMTTRIGGVSVAPFDSLNLGYSTPDKREHVEENERIVARVLRVELADIRWVYQVHGNVAHRAEVLPTNVPLGATTLEGDAIVSRTPGLICGVKVADCMPVLFAADDGSVVAAAHAGWRGLSAGVLENTLSAMSIEPNRVLVWLGSCIGAEKFEVGEDVREAFMRSASAASNGAVERAFVPTISPGKYVCDLRAIARERLRVAGVERVVASDECTVSEPMRYFSHRRDRVTGRMAAFIGIVRQHF